MELAGLALGGWVGFYDIGLGFWAGYGFGFGSAWSFSAVIHLEDYLLGSLSMALLLTLLTNVMIFAILCFRLRGNLMMGIKKGRKGY